MNYKCVTIKEVDHDNSILKYSIIEDGKIVEKIYNFNDIDI